MKTCRLFHRSLGTLMVSGKMWLSRRHPIIWGIICGVMLSLTFYLRPAETVDFIYFRF